MPKSLDERYNQGYTWTMKTAVSIPDPLYERAEKFAHRNKLSRSELYQRALAAYLTDATAAEVTSQLDEVYAGETLRVPHVLRRLQVQALRSQDETW